MAQRLELPLACRWSEVQFLILHISIFFILKSYLFHVKISSIHIHDYQIYGIIKNSYDADLLLRMNHLICLTPSLSHIKTVEQHERRPSPQFYFMLPKCHKSSLTFFTPFGFITSVVHTHCVSIHSPLLHISPSPSPRL